jgi:hypothetical protein
MIAAGQAIPRFSIFDESADQAMTRAEQQRRLMADNLRVLITVLARTRLAGRTWLFGGLLLGGVREGGLMLHDTSDTDFALHVRADRSAFWDHMHGPAIVAREAWDDSSYDPTRRAVAC